MREGATLLVDWNTEEPVYAQIARQIRSRIAAGDLPPRSVLPPVRAVAADLGVNLNTVARAYWVLEDEGFLRIQNRAGAEVLPPPQSTQKRAAVDPLREQLATVLARLRQSGVGLEELRRLVDRELAVLGSGESKR